MLNNRIFATCMAFFLVLTGGTAMAAEANSEGLVEKTVVIREKHNTFSEKQVEMLRGKMDLSSIDRMVGFIVVDVKQQAGKNLQGHHTYRFTGVTEVLDRKERKISMADLKVPCRAKLLYYPNLRKAPLLSSVKVLQTITGADSAWSKLPID